ncbi:MAG: hypothetical protein J4F99_05345 [Acidimicrobiia bacterium]|nr:hypothetical protein [Acidimicrobiia bacterium]
MTTVLVSGVGALGGWALEFLARTPGVERIVTVKRSPWQGPSLTTIAMLGSAIEGHTKHFEHRQVDLADEVAMARLLAEVRPDAVVHSATVQSPRILNSAALDPARRAGVRAATFGMWLPWQLWPAAQLMRAVELAGIDTHVVNASFPDVVNVAIWRRFGHGPSAGAGNLEVCAARVLRYVMATTGRPAADIDVSLVGSHALLTRGTVVPHHFRLTIDGVDATDHVDLTAALSTWPEVVNWHGEVPNSLYAGSAVKNALALVGTAPLSTHVSAPMGLPGGYPAVVGSGRIELRLPPGLEEAEAVAINDGAARFDGIERITDDGTVVYTAESRAAMENLGYRCEAVEFDDLARRCDELRDVYRRLISEGNDA